jgi:hypothetical protein
MSMQTCGNVLRTNHPTRSQPSRHASITQETLQVRPGQSQARNGRGYSEGWSAVSPCTVFSQNDGVTTSCHAALVAAIDIMIQ